MSTETKRRGRPPKARVEDAAVESVDVDDQDDAVHVPVVPNGPPCPRCGQPMLRSTSLLRRYDMAAVQCKPCHHTFIEGDNFYFDTDTAKSGNPPLIASRAMTLYETKNHVKPPRPARYDGAYEAMASDWEDERWVEVEL